MKRLIKHVISAIICMAVLMSGTGTGGTITVNAAPSDHNLDKFVNGGTITIKPGETKKLLMTDENDEDIIERGTYKWHTSDRETVRVYTDFANDDIDNTMCLEIVGVKAGTATIRGEHTSMPDSYDVTLTVKVTLPKATAKQKKCAHKWKTTQKATCERAGLKTCKKCKLQKEIAKQPHKYEWKEATIYHWEYLRTTRVCGNCRGENPWTYTSKQKIPWIPNVSYAETQGFYDALEEVEQAAIQHRAETGHMATHNYEEWEDEFGWEKYTYETDVCVCCGHTKEEIANADKACKRADEINKRTGNK